MKKISFVLFLTLTGLLAAALGAMAQDSPSQVYINYPQTTAQENGLQLNLYFSVTDVIGQVVPTAQVQSARIVLDDGESYDAQVQQPTTPFSIALVLDASGSMTGAAQTMQRSAIQVIQSAPTEAQFAVISFNETINVIQDFTPDHNRAINAIGNVQPVNLSGTCLYDAAYQAVQMMGSQPNGRRAIILFTDGRDETARGGGCSTHTYDEVLAQANSANFRVPIYTIGLRGSQNPINEVELRSMADSTGGFSAIGVQADLPALFQRIMDGLRSQWVASALICPTQGVRTVTLIATLSDGSMLQPDVTTFTADQNCVVPPTETPVLSPTPAQTSVQVDTIAADATDRTVAVNVLAEGQDLVSEYHFDLKDVAANTLVNSYSIDAPLPQPVILPVGNLTGGQYSIVITALAADGSRLARSDEVSFTYLPPPTATPTPTSTSTLTLTPTPTVPTNTPLPIGVNLNNIQYDAERGIILLYVTLSQPEQIASLRIEFINTDTNALERTYNPPVSDATSGVLQIPADLRPAPYSVTIISLGSSGQELSRATVRYVHAPPTATPTPTLTPTVTVTDTATATPTPTAVVVSLSINPIAPAPGAQEFEIRIQAANQEQISRYLLELVDENNMVISSFTYDVPPYDSVRFPLSALPSAGHYTISLKALGADGLPVAQTQLNIGYNPPTPLPTLNGSPTSEPTLEPTPGPAPQDILSAARAHPEVVIPVILAVIVALLVVLLIVISRYRRAASSAFLQDLSEAQQGQSGDLPPDYAPSPGSTDPEATSVVPQSDPEATSALPHAIVPSASFTIVRSRDTAMSGQKVMIAHSPFTVGRGGRDLDFNLDRDVSRNHAEITYDQGVFFITDTGSRHGTLVDGRPLTPQTAAPLRDGMRITLGTGTILLFSREETQESPPRRPTY